MIRVVVIDDEALVRTGFTHILDAADDIEVVAAVSGAQGATCVAELRPDIVLLDIRMPDTDGLTVLERIRRLPDPPVVAMLTTFDTDEYVATALRRGAAGYLLKDTDPERLPLLIAELADGATVLSATVTRTVVSGYLDHVEGGSGEPAATRLVDRITDRERAVLLLLAEGLANSEIGDRLHLSTGTVKGHVSAILGKLEVGTRVQAALLAERAGLLRPVRDGDGGER
ncbi:response regulator transcription factor [Streptomyces sp. VRA16 Mangrove soil]|uniref:response regulator n=1 Tax=Streptomyces sp. VRA16 Mangrove soil TaxID=2817434 RepID=UPI001A9FD13A|nr:response regulator transcription factor [Streptomyces sp. VRA16 Mangrove soil]MBO1330279.1 response regulator transcription factor [Streptomyces sp. VRA16 Mangrove soil]